MQQLSGKIVLVTGGGRGLGRAIALACATAGADLALSYDRSAEGARQVAAAIEHLGRQAFAVRTDLGDRAAIGALTEAVLARFGRVDVLVNNAGLFSAAPLAATTDELWDRLLAVNLTAPFLCARALAPAMLAAGGGVIINLGSGGGLHPRPGYDTSPAYAASKAGLIMLSKKLAAELAPTVRVNCLAPGVIDSKPTPMPARVRRRFEEATPLARVGRPEEIAAAAVFLASDAAAHITGQVLNVDGGILM